MIDFLKDWIFNIVTLAVFITIIELLIPSGKVKKYINLISGFILLIALINPFLKLIDKGIDFKMFQISNSNFLDRSELAANSKLLEDKQNKEIAEVYRKKIIGELEDGLKSTEGIADLKADVIINEDYRSKDFGQIKKVYLNLVPGEKSTGIKPVSKIDKVNKVEVGKNQGQSPGKSKRGADVNEELKKKIQDKVNKLLGVKNEDIVIATESQN